MLSNKKQPNGGFILAHGLREHRSSWWRWLAIWAQSSWSHCICSQEAENGQKVGTGLFPRVRIHILNNVANKKQVFKYMSPGRTSYFQNITLNIPKCSRGKLILGSCDSASENGPQLDTNKHFSWRSTLVVVCLGRSQQRCRCISEITQVDKAFTRKLKIESWETSIEDSIESRNIFSALKKNQNARYYINTALNIVLSCQDHERSSETHKTKKQTKCILGMYAKLGPHKEAYSETCPPGRQIWDPQSGKCVCYLFTTKTLKSNILVRRWDLGGGVKVGNTNAKKIRTRQGCSCNPSTAGLHSVSLLEWK